MPKKQRSTHRLRRLWRSCRRQSPGAVDLSEGRFEELRVFDALNVPELAVAIRRVLP